MATEQERAVSTDDLEKLDESIRGYIDTAVDTLTTDMDRQFKEVREDIRGLHTAFDTRFNVVERQLSEIKTDVKEIKAILEEQNPRER